MSQQDRERWNQRYAAGEYGARSHPCALLESCVTQWQPAAGARALDLACGAGRNAVFLASKGYRVDAIDISAEALARGAQRATDLGVEVNWREQDLDHFSAEPGYALIIVVRYADLELLSRLPALLQPGGRLLVEAHLGGPLFSDAVGGPGSERFRLAPGALAAACEGLEQIFQREAQVRDPDGRLMALSQYVGQASEETTANAPRGQVGR